MNNVLYDEKSQFLLDEQAAISLRQSIEEIVDAVCYNGYSNIVMIGTGRSYCHAMQLQYIANMLSDVSFYAVRAGDFIYNGINKVNQESVVVIESSAGEDEYLIEAVELCHKKRCRVIGIINDHVSTLAGMVDYLITCPVGSLYKRYYLLFGILDRSAEYRGYDALCDCLENVPQICVQAGKAFLEDVNDIAAVMAGSSDLILVGDGITWEQVNSYCMYSLEERLWKSAQCVNVGDLFHGTIEIVDRDSTVILFKGLDESSGLIDRAYRCLNRICRNVVLIDLNKYVADDAFGSYRGLMSPFVFKVIQNILNKSLEIELKHPLDIRRYVGSLEY